MIKIICISAALINTAILWCCCAINKNYEVANAD